MGSEVKEAVEAARKVPAADRSVHARWSRAGFHGNARSRSADERNAPLRG